MNKTKRVIGVDIAVEKEKDWPIIIGFIIASFMIFTTGFIFGKYIFPNDSSSTTTMNATTTNQDTVTFTGDTINQDTAHSNCLTRAYQKYGEFFTYIIASSTQGDFETYDCYAQPYVKI